jgi:hypothetical protein
MEPKDHNYLWLQFWNKVYQKNATEFQSFFEGIMLKAFFDFQKIRPYGNSGDGGNDGYRPPEGVYYQVYAPQNPQEKEAKAAKKLKEDFKKLKTNWDQISNIKKFYFVFNDKGIGSTIELAKTVAELKAENPSIEFGILAPKDLWKIFIALQQQDILTLGFDIDSTKAVANAYKLLNKLEIDIDRANGKDALKALHGMESIISGLNDDGLLLEHEILEAMALQKLEKTKESKEKYESICKRYPSDPRAFLYLAEFYLNNEDIEKNKELLEQAEKIDSTHWLLALEKLIREYLLGNAIDTAVIDEQKFPTNTRIKANFYRLYSLFLERAGDHIKAESFIEKAIHLNPEKINNYDAKLSLLEGRIFSQEDKEKFQRDIAAFLNEIEMVEQKVAEWGELSPRNKAMLNFRKLGVFRAQENLSKIDKLAKESFELILQCYFDQLIDKLLVGLLRFMELPPKDFERLLEYLNVSEKAISDDLSKAITFQFNLKNTLLTDGKKFFELKKNQVILNLIAALESKTYDDVWAILKDDLRFAVAMANTAKDFPDLRKKIIENLPNDGSIQKEKLMLLLNYDQGNIDEAFDLLKGFDFSNLGYFECRPILKIARDKKAWDFVVKILEKLLEYENEYPSVLQLKCDLFNANLHIEKFLEMIQIGESMLANDKEISLLDAHNKELILGQTIFARFKRGEYAEAKALLEKYHDLSMGFEFKVAVETEVYLKNNNANQALASVVSGVKLLKNPSPEQYGSLFIFFTEIGNLIDFHPTSLEKVEANCFIKFKEQDRWFFLGDENELDTTKIPSSDERYSKFIDKKIGEKGLFEDRYRSNKTEYTVENILTIEKYIFWQCMHHAQKLSLEHRWDMMEMIEVPTTGDTIDTKYIIARLEDERKKRSDFFDLYCQKNLPFAFLVVNEGGLTNAIGTIVNENMGFIKFSSGNLAEINQQKEVAKRVIEGKAFYLDGTSALVLSETGLLEKIYEHLPNLKVPQSVITFLLEIKEKFRYVPGQVGHMGFAQGKLTFSSVDQDKRAIIQDRFEKSIKLLESKSQNIGVISAANKSDCFSEQGVPAELCDACALAHKESTPVLTEDFLYLQANEIETKKKAPEYCSAFALARVLYEQKKISFEQYLNFFSYLSSCRFRFLPLSTEDIANAVFGDGVITTIQPENIRLFNFHLTLSEQYGVTFDTAFLVVGRFMIRVLVDDSILPEVAEKIFSEILSTFPLPKEIDKRALGKMFLRASAQTINKIRHKIITGTQIQEKIDRLSQFAEINGSINNLWIPLTN